MGFFCCDANRQGDFCSACGEPALPDSEPIAQLIRWLGGTISATRRQLRVAVNWIETNQGKAHLVDAMARVNERKERAEKTIRKYQSWIDAINNLRKKGRK